MNISQTQLTIGLIIFGGISLISAYFLNKKINYRDTIQKERQFFVNAQKNNLNSSQSDYSKLKVKKNVPVMIQGVMAHFHPSFSSAVNLMISSVPSNDDEYVRVDFQQFQIVDKKNQRKYVAIKCNGSNTLINKKLLIPLVHEEGTFNINFLYPAGITRTAQFAIAGYLSYNIQTNKFELNTKIIGVNLSNINEYLTWQNIYNICGISFCAIVIGFCGYGAYYLSKKYQQAKRK